MDKIQSNNQINQNLIGSPDWGEEKNYLYKDLRINFRETGNKSNPPLILIHGFGASCEHWRNNAEAFAIQGYRVYGIDLIGFGKSDQKCNSKIIYLNNQIWGDQLISFLMEIVDIKTQGKAILIGNSLGALTAITTLSKRPDLVKAIIAAPLPEPIFVNPISFSLPNWIKKVKFFLVKIFFNLLPIRPLINLISRTKLINIALQGAYFKSIKNDKSLKRIVSIPAKRTYAAKALKAMCIGMSNRSNSFKGPSIILKIKEITNRPPILLIWGRKDKLIPLFLAKKLIKLHPWLKLEVIDNAGHCPHDELPMHFNRIVMNWLENLKTSK